MGLNTFLEKGLSKGYLTAATGTAIVQNIDAVAGQRITIVAFGATCGSTAQSVYFMNPTKTTLGAAAVSAATTMTLTADPKDPSANAIAANDLVAIELNDGTYDYDTVSAWNSSTKLVTLKGSLAGAAAAGRGFWNFGVYTDNGHFVFAMTASTAHDESTAGGRFFAPNKGYPMKIYITNATKQCLFRYASGGYVNS